MDSKNKLNPTHPTHSYFTEWAINRLKQQFPELAKYESIIVEGANSELHELTVTGVAYGIDLNAKRLEHGGTNAGCENIEGWWDDCLAAYQAGNKEQAYFYLGVMLHMIQDMGVPAHAHGIEHQANPIQYDNFELLGTFNWKPKFDEINRSDPGYAEPWRYYFESQDWALQDTPGYNADAFPRTWITASPADQRLFMNREGRICFLTEWALNSAARGLGQLAGIAGAFYDQGDSIMDIDIFDNHAYLARGISGLQVIDISSLNKPTLRAQKFRVDQSSSRSYSHPIYEVQREAGYVVISTNYDTVEWFGINFVAEEAVVSLLLNPMDVFGKGESPFLFDYLAADHPTPLYTPWESSNARPGTWIGESSDYYVFESSLVSKHQPYLFIQHDIYLGNSNVPEIPKDGWIATEAWDLAYFVKIWSTRNNLLVAIKRSPSEKSNHAQLLIMTLENAVFSDKNSPPFFKTGGPRIAAELPLDEEPKQVVQTENFVYLMDGLGLRSIDITNPYIPVQTAQVKTSGQIIDIEGSYVYLQCDSGLTVYDFTDPRKPILSVSYANNNEVVRLPRVGSGGLDLLGYDIGRVQDGLTYLVDNNSDGFMILDTGRQHNQTEPDRVYTQPIVTLSISAPISFRYKAQDSLGSGDTDTDLTRVFEHEAANLIYTFYRSGLTDNMLTVYYSVEGTATPGSDYTGINSLSSIKSVTFAPGSKTTTVTVDPKPDTESEPDEDVSLKLEFGKGYSVGTTHWITGTIQDSPLPSNGEILPVISLTLSEPIRIKENGARKLIYTFTRTGVIATPLNVNYSVDGTASPETDYSGVEITPSTRTVTFVAGARSTTVTVTPKEDSDFEGDETVGLTLVNGEGYGYSISTTKPVVGTILDDDLPLLTLQVSPSSLVEDRVLEDRGSALDYTFTRTGVTTTPLTVYFTISGSATLNTDYKASIVTTASRSFISATPTQKTTLTFPAGSSSATVSVTPIAEYEVEANETVELTLSASTGYTIGTTGAVVGIITNDDARSTLSVAPAAVSEDGPAKLIYTFTRAGTTNGPLTVNYSIAGTAKLGVDYTGIRPNGTTKSVSFAAGATTAQVTVAPKADTLIELDETVELTLTAGTGYLIGTTKAVTGTIRNDDLPLITLSVAPASVTEDGPSNLIYTFTRSGSGALTAEPLTVNYTLGGTAELGVDYTGLSTKEINRTITFSAGANTAQVTVNPKADLINETDETVELTLAAGTGYIIGTTTTTAVGMISNDDTRITLAVSPSFVSEDGNANLIYTFTRIGDANNPLTVNYSVGGAAQLGSDYTGISTTGRIQTIEFPAGISTTSIEVDPTADTAIEADETVALTLVGGSGYIIDNTKAVTATIKNDDLPFVTLAVSPASVTEDGSSNLIYTFTRSGSGALSTTPLTVNYTVSGTAELETDYSGIAPTGATKSITFATGATTASVIVDPKGDATVEPDETVALTLAASTGYTIGTTTSVVGTILNDDPRVTLEISPTAVIEDDPTNLIYTFRRTGPTTSALTVNYIVAGTATLDTDYTGISPLDPIKTLTFAPGAAIARVTVNPTADRDSEPDETVALTLAAGSDYTIGTSAAVVGTIRNDDPKISLTVSAATVSEDGPANLIYNFTRTGAPTDALSVNYTVGGSARLGLDYTGISSTGRTKTITFASGATTATVEVDPSADIAIEWDESVDLTLVAGTGYTLGAKTWASGTIQNDDFSSSVTSTLGATGSSLLLVGNKPINGTGNSLNNTLTGNSNNNRLTGLLGADVLTGGGTTDSDLYVYTSLNESLLGPGNAFDQITDFNSNDRLSAPPTVAKQRLTSAFGNADSLTETSIAALFTASAFAANSVAAFTTSGLAGTFIAMNDARSGYQADSDAIVFLRNYGISSTDVVEFV